MIHESTDDRSEKRLSFSKTQYKYVKFCTTDFSELKDFEILKIKINMSYLSDAETLYFYSGSVKFVSGS